MDIENLHFSWIFSPGDYYIMAYDVKMYSEINGQNIIGVLNVHDKIEILENMYNEERFDEITSCWYKIKYNDIIGYIWGGNIAKETFIFDIDNNGVIDYFQYRISSVFSNFNISANRDILIFLNGENISSNLYSNIENGNYNQCFFSIDNGIAIIELFETSLINTVNNIFKMDVYGNILLKEIIMSGRFWKNGQWVIYE